LGYSTRKEEVKSSLNTWTTIMLVIRTTKKAPKVMFFNELRSYFMVLKKQLVVSLFTTEAEFIAAASSSYEVVWIRRIMKSLNQVQSTPMKVYCDNISAIKLSKNPVMHGHNKHINIRFYFL
jgi:hypothetical protein